LRVRVRVRVRVRGDAVGRPARVPDARVRAPERAVRELGLQALDAAFLAADREPSRAEDGDAGRVVPAVLEQPQPFEQGLDHRSLTQQSSDDAAHAALLQVWSTGFAPATTRARK